MRRTKAKIVRLTRIAALTAMGMATMALFLVLPLPNAALADDLDKQFKDMGIIKMPNIPPPIDFTLSDMDSRKVRLSDLKGKVVVVNFWTTWCPSCRIEMPDLEKLHQRFKPDEFILLAVALRESRQTVQQFLQRFKLNFTTLLDNDGRVGRSFGIRSIPTTFIINQSGGMIGKANGPRPWGGDRAFALFEQLIQHPSSSESDSQQASR